MQTPIERGQITQFWYIEGWFRTIRYLNAILLFQFLQENLTAGLYWLFHNSHTQYSKVSIVSELFWNIVWLIAFFTLNTCKPVSTSKAIETMEVKVGKLSTTDFECGLLKIKKFMSVPTWIENAHWKLHDSSKSLLHLKMNSKKY